LQIALTATPLAAYFFVLGILHSGKRPRMVSGPVDVGLLTFGVGGLVAFGPFGRAVLGRLVGEGAGPVAWIIWIGVVGLWSLVLAGSASLRVTIYHIDARELDRAVLDALKQLPGAFSPTLSGYEDVLRGSGIAVKSLWFLRSGAVEAYGREPDLLIRELKPKLREILADRPQRPSNVSHAMFSLACLTMIVPVAGYMAGFFTPNPRTKDVLRILLNMFRWR
jgi:hypothetical protein